MSLPVPSTSRAPLTKNEQEMELFDMPLIALTNKCHGDLRQLLFAFFSFLYRRTDFYIVHDDTSSKNMGFKQGDAEKLLLAAFRQFPLRKIPSNTTPPSNSNTNDTTIQKPDESNKTTIPKAVDTSKHPSPDSSALDNPPPVSKNVKEASASSSNGVTDSKTDTTKTSKSPPSTETTKSDSKDVKPKSSSLAVNTAIRYTEEGKQLPVGNGGTTKLYTWTQTLDECTVILNKKFPVRGKDLQVTIQSNSISVKLKNGITQPNTSATITNADDPTTFLEGKLVESILPNESSWTIEDGIIILVLFKKTKTFWKTVVEGDDEIDATLVDSRRNIDTYDAATQAQIRKIIFDQNQYHKGLPTSDEIIGQKVPIPPLPPGVEYIDQSTLDAAAAASTKPTPSST